MQPEDMYVAMNRQQYYDNMSHVCNSSFPLILSSEVATFFNFAKASIGSGSFALPWGILQAGVIVGGFGMIYLGLLR